MDRTLGHRVAAVAAAGTVTVGLGWLTGLADLALVAGACWGVGLACLFRARRQFPRPGVGDGWTDARWTGLAVAVVTLAALLGVSPALALSPAARFGLSVLVLGAGLAAFATATLAELERRDEATAGVVSRTPSRDER